ncbi:Transglutaminase-like superfamily-domain-containing protein [Echria macrotheca]|uniref:Transglutaminase-like superfamily-domain-containing protein n=1 Tax=Echria macrotheca TaxID=438768 RepID=A0AAJ0F7N1_9PEZI|nr:Transglutaminase-like superfamily-domain-containing protein [Echria macrotheca]
MPGLSLDLFPDEIIRHILLYVPPHQALTAIQPLSRRFKSLASESLLWRYYCQTTFSYWDKKHEFRSKLAAPAVTIDWKRLWIARTKKCQDLAVVFEEILREATGDLERYRRLGLEGYDVKDYLLSQISCDSSLDDALARRYYAFIILDSINRGVAVELWSKFQWDLSSRKGLDGALAAFDMFFLHDQPQDIDYIMDTLDSLSRQFRDEHPRLRDMSTRQKALVLVSWLRRQNLTGMDHAELNYRNLRNCLIGHALSEEEHSSLPIISSAIYCSIAERVGLDASCCAFPSHVHAAVHSPLGETLDGDQRDETFSEIMYLDPFGSSEEVTIQDLRERLVEFGWREGTDAFLKPTPVSVIVQRTVQNIRETYSTYRSLEGTGQRQREYELSRLRSGIPGLNMDLAAYAVKWAELMIRPANSDHWGLGLDLFLHRFALTYKEDIWLIEKYLLPLYDQSLATQPGRQRESWENVRTVIEILENLDSRLPVPSRRYTREIEQRVLYKVGQVFRHRRYGYIAIINGWALKGSGLVTTEPMPEDGDSSGPKTFYSCMNEGGERHLVDQENMDIVTDPALVSDELLFLAGRFFKRFDRATCTFVPLGTEAYPDG